MGAENIGNADIGFDSGGAKLSESAKEQFSDNLKKQQKANKNQKIVERKAKQYDNTLVIIIKSMLNGGGNYDFLIALISDLIDKNIPSDFILAIISISNSEALKKSELKIQEGVFYEFNSSKNSLIKYDNNDDFSSKLINRINIIYSISIIEKDSVLDSIIDHNTWKCIPSLQKLFFELLNIEMQKIGMKAGEKEKIFSEFIFDKIIDKIQAEMY